MATGESRESRFLLYDKAYPLIHATFPSDEAVVEDSPCITGSRTPPEKYAEAPLAWARRNCLYIPELDGDVDFNKWLDRFRPSQIYSFRDNVERIAVLAPPEVHALQPRVGKAKVKEEWEAFLQSGRSITRDRIQEIAQNVGLLSGKWMAYVDTGPGVDRSWRSIATAVVSGRFGPACTGAKVATFEQPGRMHTICVWNKNFTDYEEVTQMEEVFRSIKHFSKCIMNYKADIYTELAIYGNSHAEDFGVHHHLYMSVYKKNAGRTEVTNCYLK